LLRSGVVSPVVPAEMDEQRRRLNDKFVVAGIVEDGAARIRHTLAAGPAPVEATIPVDEDRTPPDAWLAALTPGVDTWMLDGAAFADVGGRPRLVAAGALPLAETSAAE